MLVLLALMICAQAEGKPVARLLGLAVAQEDCRSPSLGIGSPGVGLDALVESAMMEELGKAESIALTPDEFHAYIARMDEARKRLPEPPVVPPFDKARAEQKLAAIREKLAKKDLPLLERKALEDQEKGRVASIEYGSEDAVMAATLMPRLKFYAAVQRKYGGNVYAAGLGLVPLEALERCRADMEGAGKIAIEDEGLKKELKARADSIRKPETIVPSKQVSFRWPFFLEF